jgi:hypothetical protein
MPMLTRLSAGLAALCGSLAWAMSSFPAGAASIETQRPCVGPSGYCSSFGPNDTIPIIRGITFNAPKAGTAQVTFHGSLYCGTPATTVARIDLVSQIVDRKIAVSDLSKAGSLRHAASYVSNNLFYGWSTSFQSRLDPRIHDRRRGDAELLLQGRALAAGCEHHLLRLQRHVHDRVHQI